MLRTKKRRRASSLVVLLTALMGAGPVAAQVRPPSSLEEPLPTDPAVTVGTLENGLRYYIRTNQRPEDRAELRLVVNVGSVLEDDDQRGLAHFLEHMAFNGTANFEKQEIVDYLESIGMEFGPEVNAYTSFDETVYMLEVPTDDPEILGTAFQIMEDWAHLVALEPEEVEKERGVVIEEWRLGRGAQARMMDKQFPVLFHQSRYAERLVIGSVEILETFPAETLRRFYEDWYRPDLMAVVAVGDFDPAEVEAKIQEHFSRIRPVAEPRARQVFELPGHPETLYAIASDPEANASQVALLYKQPLGSTGTLADYRQRLVELLFNGMLNARMFELTQQADPPFVAGGAGQGRFVRSAEIFQLGAMVQEGGIQEGMAALLTEAERVARHGFTEGELTRQKAEMLRGMEQAFAERENQPSARYASEYVNHFLQGEPFPGIEFEFEATQALLPSISAAEVTALARTWLVDHSRVVMVNVPEKEGVSIPTEDELASIFEETVAAEITPYEDTASEEALLPVLPEPSPVVEETTVPEVGATVWTLDNGVRVVLKPTDFKDDQVLLQAFSPGGYSLSAEDQHMSASNAAQMVTMGGVGSFGMIDLDKKLAGKAVRVGPFISELNEGFSGSASPKDLETLFQLVHLYFTAPRKDEVAFQALSNQIEAVMANREADPGQAFRDTLLVTMSQGHPRARPFTLETFQEIDLDEAFDFYRDRFADASDFTFVFVGALDTEAMRPLVERYLGGLPSSGREETWIDLDVDPPFGVIKKEVRKGVEPQSQTQIRFTGPFEWTPDKRVGIRVLASVLQSRLGRLIREDMSGTYGVQVSRSYGPFPDPTYELGISFGSDPGRVQELVDAIFAELTEFRDQGPTPEEVEAAIEQERRAKETNVQENAWWASQLRFSFEYGTDPGQLLDSGPLDRVTAETIQADARILLRLDNYVQVTLVPESGTGAQAPF
jgi:zinc protease